MRTAVKWTVLFLGFFILIYVASIYVRLANVMSDHGGIPWSRDFVESNLTGFVILPSIGLIMLVTGFVLLVRNR